ncbi:MAG: hypothetical protein RL490_967 [Pseudomonadota bacterium]|jgi:hypothetical protein
MKEEASGGWGLRPQTPVVFVALESETPIMHRTREMGSGAYGPSRRRPFCP